MTLPDERCDMVTLLDLMWGTVDPTTRLPKMVTADRVLDIIRIADKYDVSALVHNVYTVLIFRAEDCGDREIQFSSFLYAMYYGDPWLCYHVLSRWEMEDPVYWEDSRIDLIGHDMFFVLLRAYPRQPATRGNRAVWSEISTSIVWSDHMPK